MRSQTEYFCHFGLFFALLPPTPSNPENQNFRKLNKASRDVIILNLWNQNHDHMIYAYSDIEGGRHNFLLF